MIGVQQQKQRIVCDESGHGGSGRGDTRHDIAEEQRTVVIAYDDDSSSSVDGICKVQLSSTADDSKTEITTTASTTATSCSGTGSRLASVASTATSLSHGEDECESSSAAQPRRALTSSLPAIRPAAIVAPEPLTPRSKSTSQVQTIRDRNCNIKTPPPLDRARPRSSCLRVKTQDESVHSFGLSRHSLSSRTSKTSRRQRLTSNNSSSVATTLPDHDDDMSSSLGVSFRNVEVREYPITIGDNPSVISGPPVAIDWDYDDSIELDIEEFESCRSTERRNADNMRLDASEREELVRENGYTQRDIAQAVRQVGRDRRSRRRSVHNLGIMKFDEGVESAGRKLKRLVLRKKRDDALYKEWCRRKAVADSIIAEENEAAEIIADMGEEGDMGLLTAKAAAMSVEEEMALWDTVSTKAGTPGEGAGGTSILTTRAGMWPGMKKARAPPIIIEEDSTHHGKRLQRENANAA